MAEGWAGWENLRKNPPTMPGEDVGMGVRVGREGKGGGRGQLGAVRGRKFLECLSTQFSPKKGRPRPLT